MTALVQKYLSANNYNRQRQAFGELFSSHPDYPSIFAITDTLDALSIENTAVNLPKEQLDQLPPCFLAIYQNDLALVTKKGALLAVEKEQGKKELVSPSVFTRDWTGVVIAVEPGAAVMGNKKLLNPHWLRYCIPVLLLVLISFACHHYSSANIGLLCTSFDGVLLSVLITREKLGIQHELVSRYCHINPAASCTAVIRSGSAVMNKWLDFADLPLIFFTVNAFTLLLQPAIAGKMVGLLSLAALPVIAYTLWLQQFRLKKWCLLCLAVSLLIIVQALVFVLTELPLHNIINSGLLHYLFATVLITAAWLAIKPVITRSIKADKAISRLTRFKRNYALFRFLSKAMPCPGGLDELEAVRLGNKKAGVKLTLIVSPSCGFCHDAIEAAFKLIKQYPGKICLNVLFNVNPDNQRNPYSIVAERLITINQTNPMLAIDALADWHIHKTGLDVWTEKWQTGPGDVFVNDQLQQQYQWCMMNGLNYSPVRILNGRLMPDEYDIEELKYFLNELQADRETAVKNILTYR